MLSDLVLSTLVSGSIYAMLGMGLVVVWGTCNIFNFAHGTIYMLSAYVAWVCLSIFNVPFLAATSIALLFIFALGYCLSIVMKPLRLKKDSDMLSAILTFGLSLLIENSVLLVFGARYKHLPPFLNMTFEIAEMHLTGQEVLIIALGIFFFAGLHLFFSRSRTGLAISAVAHDYNMVQLIGGNPERIYAAAMGLGFAFAGSAGLLMGSIQFLSPTMGSEIFIKSFIVAALGGSADFRRPIFAAYSMAAIETTITTTLGFYWSTPLLLFVLIFFSQIKGLFGRS